MSNLGLPRDPLMPVRTRRFMQGLAGDDPQLLLGAGLYFDAEGRLSIYGWPGVAFLNPEPGEDGQPGMPGPPGQAGPAGQPVFLFEDQPENEPWPLFPPERVVVSAVTTPAVPATDTAVVNSTGVPVTVYLKGGTLTAITIGGIATGITVEAPANQAYALPLAKGQTITITFTVAPTWVWIGN